MTNTKPLVLRGRIKGYASFLALVLEGTFEDEEPFKVFLGSDRAYESSRALCLPIVEIMYQRSLLKLALWGGGSKEKYFLSQQHSTSK